MSSYVRKYFVFTYDGKRIESKSGRFGTSRRSAAGTAPAGRANQKPRPQSLSRPGSAGSMIPALQANDHLAESHQTANQLAYVEQIRTMQAASRVNPPVPNGLSPDCYLIRTLDDTSKCMATCYRANLATIAIWMADRHEKRSPRLALEGRWCCYW